jgi:hypothetical protein
MKAVVLILALVAAVAFGQATSLCSATFNQFDCGKASGPNYCCLWYRPAGNDNDANNRCISGYTSNAADGSAGNTIPCPGANAGSGQSSTYGGSCSATSLCPSNNPPDITGTWFYPAQCGTIGGQFSVIITGNNTNGPVTNTFAVRATNQALRINPNLVGTVNYLGQLQASQVDPTTGQVYTCTGSASNRQMNMVCPGSNCVTFFYRSAANVVAVSVLALVACIGFLALF